MRRLLVAVAAVALAGAPALDGPARAAEGGEFSLRPVRPASAPARERSYVVRTVGPGTGFDDRLEARNLTDEPLDLVVEAVDADVTPDGSFAPGDTRNAVGGWLRVSPGRVRVPARGGVPVSLRVDVPADAPAGDHIAAVVVRRDRPVQGDDGVQLVNRVGVRVYLTVSRAGAPPPSRAFELRGFRWTGTPAARRFEVTVANTGGLLVEPSGALTVARGDLAATSPVPVLGTVPPGAVLTFPVRAAGTLEPGRYQARLRLRAVDGGPEQEATVAFTVRDGADRDRSLPWLPIAVALAALLAVAVGSATRFHRTRTVQET